MLSISSIAFVPYKSNTFFACSAPIPNLSKNPTICHTSQFSIKLSDISFALSFVIPFICTNFDGSYFNTCMVSSPNNFIILLAVAGPTPFIFPILPRSRPVAHPAQPPSNDPILPYFIAKSPSFVNFLLKKVKY